MPVNVKSENVFVEMIFRGAVADDEAGVDETAGDGIAQVSDS